MKEEKYFLDFSKTIRKCIIMYEVKGSVHSPIMYIKKPKWRSEEEFVEFVKSLQIYITKKP
jgi:hypothetical protein